MQKVIVTGAAGFIGSHVTKKLVAEGIQVIAVVRSAKKAAPIYERSTLLRIVECDMLAASNLHEMIPDQDIDTCYHFAWEGVSGANIANGYLQLDNVKNMLTLLHELNKMKIKRFIGAGSIHELEYLYTINSAAHTPPPLSSIYKACKLNAHYMAYAICESMGIDFLWPIITNTYGEGEQSNRLIISTIKKLLAGESPHFTSGDQLYNFSYISDVAEAFYLIGQKGRSNRNYIISDGNLRPLKEYLTELGEIVAPNILLQFGTPGLQGISLPSKDYDNAEFIQDIGMAFHVPFSEGITKTAAWLREQM